MGRFLYTPLLPLMLAEYGLRTEQAGLLASLNYVGYLIGAFAAGQLCHRYRELRVLAAGLLLSCLSTVATGIFTDFPTLCAVRFIAGIASALAFVAVSGLVLHIIAHNGREHLAGLYYGGVGGGIVITGVAALPLARLWGAGGAWIFFGIASIALSLLVLLLVRGSGAPQHAGATGKAPLPRDPRLLRLVLSYGLEGFGYIITGTFMVAAAISAVGPTGAHLAWIIAGCAALPSAFLWSIAARRWGRLKPLIAAFFLQGIGILLPAVFSGTPALVAGAVLFGATFMGIVTLALSEGASYAPLARARIVALMTGIYGIGQICGPAVAGYLSARTGSYDVALVIAAVFVVAAGVLLVPDVLARRDERE